MEHQKEMGGCSRAWNLKGVVQEAEKLEALLTCSFGPGGRGALVQQPMGHLTITRSGWAILKAVYDEESQQPPNPICRMLLEYTGKIENSLGDGVKCFVFMLTALLRHLQHVDEPRYHLISELNRLQISLAQLTLAEYGAGISSAAADHCIKVTSAYFHSRFPVLVCLSLAELFHKWLDLYLTEPCDGIISTLHHLYKNFAVLCCYQNLGSRSVSDSHVVSGLLVSRPALNLCHPGLHIIKILLFDDKSDLLDIHCEVNRFLEEVANCIAVDILLLTSCVLPDVMLFYLRQKNIAVLHGVPHSEVEYISSVLQTDLLVEVTLVVEGTKKCTLLGLPGVRHLVLCGPTETLAREYAASCLSALRLLHLTAKHSTLVKGGGWFEKTLNSKLISKLDSFHQRQSVLSVTSRAELLAWHQQRQNLKMKGGNTFGSECSKVDHISSEMSMLSCCSWVEEMDCVAEALSCADRNLVLALAGSLLAVPRKLAGNHWSDHGEALESLAFKTEIIQHVIIATVQILSIGGIANISKASKTMFHS